MKWLDDPHHHAWLAGETGRLLDFHAAARDPAGGFGWLHTDGTREPDRPAELWVTARMTHSYALGTLLGRPGCAPLVEHGLAALRGMFHDDEHGGWFWHAYPDRPADERKQTYGHAFVLLAASSAAQAGYDTTDLLAEVLNLLRTRFMDRVADGDRSVFVEGWDRTFETCEPYRGQNPNMHLVEAYMAAAEATNRPELLDIASGIAEVIVNGFARAADWRVIEHFSVDWQPDLEFNRANPRDMLRPYGATPGHYLEWARLLLQLRGLRPLGSEWILPAAQGLFDAAIADGWDTERGGLVYTVDWDGAPGVSERFHWGAAEAVGAAATLFRCTGEQRYADWYRTFWDHIATHLIDRRGGWWHELTPTNEHGDATWPGRPDLYHALQATLIARIPIETGFAEAARTNRVMGLAA